MQLIDDLRSIVREELGKVASPFLVNRAEFLLQSSSGDKKGVAEAIEKVRRMTALFIDKNLADQMCRILRAKADANG